MFCAHEKVKARRVIQIMGSRLRLTAGHGKSVRTRVNQRTTHIAIRRPVWVCHASLGSYATLRSDRNHLVFPARTRAFVLPVAK